jgi:hypothetical protein
MNVGIGNEALQSHFWEYMYNMFQVFGIVQEQTSALPGGRKRGGGGV